MSATPATPQLSELSEEWLGQADIKHRKKLGQYMTPEVLRDRLIKALEITPGARVLDPGVGTGEFLKSVHETVPTASLYGWDVDPLIAEVAKRQVPKARIELRSALDPYAGEPFDFVIGNPPYFQFRASPEERSRFAQVISGRPNIFALFFKSSLDVLREGGKLGFVVPPSMNNGAYFDALRNFIVKTGTVDFLQVVDDAHLFADAQTAVQLIVITKRSSGRQPHVFTRTCAASGFTRTIFAEQPKEYSRQFEGRSSLFELGFEAVTGTVIWNQVRDQLRTEPEPGSVPLIWANNLRDGQLFLENDERRPQYVLSARTVHGPAIAVNRIVGSVGAGTIRCALIPAGMEFAGENHTNIIRARGIAKQLAGWDQLVAALQSPATAERVRLLTGNTQVSATELTHLLPLDID
jgi:adenine-specific DNA-methyltransferase